MHRSKLLRAGATSLLVLASFAVISAGSAQDKKEMNDNDKLQGAWRAVGGESGGTKIKGADLGNLTLTFKDKLVRWEQMGSEALECSVTLAPAKSPKHIDFGQKAPVGKKPAPGLSGVGIYKFDGEKLYICLGLPNEKSRPKDFASPQGTISTLYVFERVRADSK